MTVKEFKKFCCINDIVLKDSYTGRVYSKLDKYLDREVTVFYPRFDMMQSNDSYTPFCRIQIVGWIPHNFEEDLDEHKKAE